MHLQPGRIEREWSRTRIEWKACLPTVWNGLVVLVRNKKKEKMEKKIEREWSGTRKEWKRHLLMNISRAPPWHISGICYVAAATIADAVAILHLRLVT